MYRDRKNIQCFEAVTINQKWRVVARHHDTDRGRADVTRRRLSHYMCGVPARRSQNKSHSIMTRTHTKIKLTLAMRLGSNTSGIKNIFP
jgi:hypothetical protein